MKNKRFYEHDLDTAIANFSQAQETYCRAKPGPRKTAALANRDQAIARVEHVAAQLRKQKRGKK
jgi:hypothetical protein